MPPGSGDGEPACLADEAGSQPVGTGGLTVRSLMHPIPVRLRERQLPGTRAFQSNERAVARLGQKLRVHQGTH